MRQLSPDEQALWAKVVASVQPLHKGLATAATVQLESEPEQAPPARLPPKVAVQPVGRPPRPQPGSTLDGTWDRRLSGGLVQPDAILDLHGHNLATAHAVLDDRLDVAISLGARLLLLITGKPPVEDRRSNGRGAIRAAIGDWLAASRHAAAIAAVRNAHPKHGGAGALYIVLRKRRG